MPFINVRKNIDADDVACIIPARLDKNTPERIKVQWTLKIPSSQVIKMRRYTLSYFPRGKFYS